MLKLVTLIARLALTITGIVVLAAIAYGLLAFDRKADQLLGHADALVTDTQKRLDGTFGNVDAVLTQYKLTADEIRRTSITERAYLATISRETVGAVASANKALRELDGVLMETRQIAAGINTDTLPRVNVAVESISGVATETKSAVAKLSGVTDGLATEATVALGDIHVILSAPEVREIAPSLAGATKNLDGALANVEETTRYIADDFKPTKRNFWHNLTSEFIPTLLRFLLPTPVRIVTYP